MRGVTGITLIELMVSLSIAAIMMTLAVPSFVTMFNNNRVRVQADNFIVALALARSEAINRGGPVTVCKKNAAGTACDSSADWNSGLLIYFGSGTVTPSSSTIIRVIDGNSLVTVTADAEIENYITYLSSGSAIGNGGAPDDSVIKFCGSTDNDRQVVIGATGRPRVEEVAC